MPKGIYKRTKPPWNKGLKADDDSRVARPWLGKKRPTGKDSTNWKGGLPDCDVCGKKLSLRKYRRCIKCSARSGKDNNLWRGDDVGYHGVHKWVYRIKGKAVHCEHCGIKNAKRYEWANIDHKYRRVADDYISLCVPCHRKHDYGRM